MKETSDLFGPTTSEATGSATSSPASGSGVTHSGSRDGPTMSQSGAEAAHAKPSAAPGARAVSTMSAISGRTGKGSSASSDLAWSLASRLQAVTGSLGSTLFALTWKSRVTPSRRLIYALRASVPPTSGSDCSSWPTPDAGGFGIGDSNWQARRAQLAQKYGNNGFGLTLGMAAQLAPWATPQVSDSLGGGSVTEAKRRAQGKRRPSGASYGSKLRNDALLADSGETPSGLDALTAKRGQLNPAHPRWLMGLPLAWDACAPTETRSMLKSRRASSAPTEKSGGLSE